MPRITVRLSEERYGALCEIAGKRGLSMSQVVDDALELAGIGPKTNLMRMLGEARQRSGLTEEEAMALALRETRAYRAERRR